MKIYTIINIARQVNGPMYFVMVEKAFEKKDSAEKYLKNVGTQYMESRMLPTGQLINCEIDRGISEIEVQTD